MKIVMKKKYIAPELAIELMETQQIIALSLKDEAADNSTVLTKYGDEWDIWSDDEVVE
jgi:hypothetical protein